MPPKNNLLISIIVPALNEDRYIQKCLSAILDFDFPKDRYEVIVVDNGSNDSTVSIAKDCGVKVLSKTIGTIGSLRNYGTQHSKGDIFAFVDADCQPPRNWLRDAIDHFQNSSVGAVGCRLRHDESTWVARSWSLMHSERIEIGETNWLPSGNMLVSKESFQMIGGFDERLVTSEDYDLCFRLRAEGYRIISDPRVSSLHLDPPKTLVEFYKKERWHGQEMLRTLLSGRAKVSSAFLYSLFYLLCIAWLLIGVARSLLVGDLYLLFISVLMFVFPSMLLAFITVRRSNASNAYRSFFGLSLIYLVYGTARAISLVNIRKPFTLKSS